MSDSVADIGKAYIQLVPSMRGVQGSVEELLGGTGSGASKRFSSNFVGGLKVALVSAGIGKAFQAAISEGSELEQNLGGTEAVFQEYASDIQSIASTAYKNMGMSASEYMATANKMTSLFKGSGLDIKSSMDLTTSAMQRAADVASVMGIDTAWAMESIAGAAKGNFTMMDNLGVAMNATTLQAYALEKGINFNWNTASNAEKATVAMEMFMERTQDMAGNFAKEASETISGSKGAMVSAFKDVLGNLTLGKDITPSLKALVSTTVTFIGGNLIPAVVTILKGLPTALFTAFQELVPTLLTSGQELVQNLKVSIDTFLPAFMTSGIETINNFVTGLFQSLPNLIASFGQLLSNVTSYIMSKMPDFITAGMNVIMNFIQGFFQSIPSLILAVTDLILQFITTVGMNLPMILQTGIELILSMIAGILEAIPQLLAEIPNIFRQIKEKFLSVDWLGIGIGIIEGIIKGIVKAAQRLVEAALDAAKAAFDAMCNFLGIHSPATKGIWVGEMWDRGVALGVKSNAGIIQKEMRKVSNESISPIQTNAERIAIKGTGLIPEFYGNNDTKMANGFSQQIIINSPTELSPSEIARQTRNATRQMALSLNLGG